MITTETFAIGWAVVATVGAIVVERLCACELRAGIRALKTAHDALVNEQIEGDHFRELADDALANIERLREDLRHMKAEAGRQAGALFSARNQLRRIAEEREAEIERRRVKMRAIGIIGNKSPKRRVSRAKAA